MVFAVSLRNAPHPPAHGGLLSTNLAVTEDSFPRRNLCLSDREGSEFKFRLDLLRRFWIKPKAPEKTLLIAGIPSDDGIRHEDNANKAEASLIPS